MITRFLRTEAASGVLLLGATIAALVWANSPWQAAYEDLWSTTVGGHDLHDWVNDGLMALFFFVIGLEVRREVTTGQLASRHDAALPVVAALGGMLVPAALYLALNAGGEHAQGWGVPMATDIAFAVGALSLMGSRVPDGLKVLLLALAVADDVGAIAVIALVYTDDLSVPWLVAALVGLAVVAVVRRLGVVALPVYTVLGCGVWWATLQSGVHATIAGVALAFLVPSGDRLETALHPWTSFVVLPIFALANAGIPVSSSALQDAAGSSVSQGVVLGLVVGKLVGILGASAIGVRCGIARLPDGVSWRHVAGMAGLAGIGFTVSIFISGLAFDEPAIVDEAKLGVLVASVLAAALGAAVLARSPTEAQDVDA